MVNLVDVGLLGRERDIGLDLVSDFAKQRIVNQLMDHAVLVRSRPGISRCILLEDGFVEQALAETGFGTLIGECCAKMVSMVGD